MPSFRSPLGTITVLSFSVSEDIEQENEYGLLLDNKEYKYVQIHGTYANSFMNFAPILLPLLPPIPPGDWNVGRIGLKAGQPALLSTAKRQIPGIENAWHPNTVEFTSLDPIDTYQDNVWRVRIPNWPEPVVAKFGPFPYAIGYYEDETWAYEMIDGLGIGPKFLGHLVENGRIIGFLIEHRQGRCANIGDVETCRRLVKRLHDRGFMHGDLNRYNFVINEDSGLSCLVDFQALVRTDDREALDRELAELIEKLQDESGLGGVIIIKADDICLETPSQEG